MAGREEVPVGREEMLVGRREVPVGREEVLVGRKEVPVGREEVPVGRKRRKKSYLDFKVSGKIDNLF